MALKHETRLRGNAGRTSKVFCLAAERIEDTKPLPLLQADFLARRFGLAPALASAIAAIAFSTMEMAR